MKSDIVSSTLMPSGRGNHAFRRMLARFEPSDFGRFKPKDAFRSRWQVILKSEADGGENIAYRLAKLANRPLDRQNPPSWRVCNNWNYVPNCLQLSQR